MKCDEFRQLLGQEPDEHLPEAALSHLNACEGCRGLAGDLDAIRSAALKLGSAEIQPPESVWISLRRELVAEGLLREPRRDSRPVTHGWWSFFQRPAAAGAFLALLVAAAGLFGYQHAVRSAARRAVLVTPHVEPAAVRSMQRIFKEEEVDVVDRAITQLAGQNSAVADSLRRNLSIVDNFIAQCEKSVREQPNNEMAREYLYGAYEQKAELLNAALTRDTTGGLQ